MWLGLRKQGFMQIANYWTYKAVKQKYLDVFYFFSETDTVSVYGLLCCPVDPAISQHCFSDPCTDFIRFAHVDNGFHHVVVLIRTRHSVVEPLLDSIEAFCVAVADGELRTMFQKELSCSKADGTSCTSYKNDLAI